MLRIVFLLLIATSGFASKQEKLEQELFGSDDTFKYFQPMCLVCGASEDLIILESCKHFTQCRGCTVSHVKSKLDSGYLPHCITEGCNTRLSLAAVSQILGQDPDADTLKEKYRNLAIKNSETIRCCPVDKQTLTKSARNDWHQYCEGCRKVHCFQCGASHERGLSCLEASPEQYQSVIDLYREMKKQNPNIQWKICPYCGTPAEKKDGCNEVKCGRNYHSTHAHLAHSFGCGRSFYWGKARVFDPDKKMKIGKSTLLRGGQNTQNIQVQFAYQAPEWLNSSQIATLYTNKMAIDAGTSHNRVDFSPYMELFNQRVSAWLDEKKISQVGEASSAYLTLKAVWRTTWNAAEQASIDGVKNALLGSDASTATNVAKNTASNAAGFLAMQALYDTAWVVARNPAYDAAWNTARNAAWNEAWGSIYHAAENAVRNEVLIAQRNALSLQQIGEISYRTAERTALIYLYENLIETLDQTNSAQSMPWTASKSRMIKILDELQSKEGDFEGLLSPFTEVLREYLDFLPEKKRKGIWTIFGA